MPFLYFKLIQAIKQTAKMSKTSSYSFKAPLDIIGINPFVFVPETILHDLFRILHREKGNIAIKVSVNRSKYHPQTLLRYKGDWRLYINTSMLKDSPKRLGEELMIKIKLDFSERKVNMHPKLQSALDENREAKAVFDSISPTLRKEIVRYIANLKTENSIVRNTDRAIAFLLGQGSFIGRNKI